MSIAQPRARRLRSGTRCGTSIRLLAVTLTAASPAAQASFLSGDALDTAADYMSWFVLAVVPIVLIALFWIVHVMPEKIAIKRHHPQKAAIHTLCLLSLLFGGLLWPLAWLWAYTKPVTYKLAYGTDKHEDFYTEHAAMAESGELSDADRAALKDELDLLDQRGQLTPELKQARAKIQQAGRQEAAAEGSA